MNDVTVVKPKPKWMLFDFREIWRYRELLLAFVIRDIKVRYRQTIVGGLWAIAQPFTTMVVFSFFFGYIAKISSGGVPYPVFSYAGLVLWSYFTNSLTAASNSMVGNAGLITKVYFPRVIVPIAATVSGLLDYLVAFSIMFLLMVYFRVVPGVSIFLVPFVVLLTWFLSIGLGFWLSAINVKYRDVGYILPFFIQILLFATPIIYPVSIAPNFKWLLLLNPMTGIIETHRALILGNPVPINELILSVIFTAVISIGGLIYFKRAERHFADII
jgi:lipopolysaccharide transport system permease protein